MTRINSTIPIAATLIILAAASAAGRTIYVDADATGPADGTSWQNAYRFLHDALADAYVNGEPADILVAEGIYTPDKNSFTPNGSGSRNAVFDLATDFAIRGGYAGFGQPEPDKRDIEKYRTTLSGDLADNDEYLPDVRDSLLHPTRSENSYHVLAAIATGPTAVLEGFTITGGNANGAQVDSFGAGLLITEGSPTIIDCTFTENSAGASGGAIDNQCFSNLNYTSPTIADCTFDRNYAQTSGGAIGNYISAPSITACTFTENRSHAGAAIKFDHSTSVGTTELQFCAFLHNKANGYGGALYNKYANPIMTNCLFEANAALDPAGGVGGAFANVKSYLTLVNCTIVANRAPRSGSVMQNSESAAVAVNSIIWDNPDGDADISIALDTLSYFEAEDSLIQYGWTGPRIMDEDPLFARPGVWNDNGTPEDETDDFWTRGDYHLKSSAGRYDPNNRNWINDDVTSPCIDTGYSQDPYQNELLPNGWRINMGVFGGTTQASMSRCPSGNPADVYINANVDMFDLLTLSSRWLAQAPLMPEDINRDGIVNLGDLAEMFSEWGPLNYNYCSATLLEDSFENGEWNGLWTQDQQNDWSVSNENVADANFAAAVKGIAHDAALTSIPMQLGEMDVAVIQFGWCISDTFGSGDYLAFDISTDDGATWQQKARIDGDTGPKDDWRAIYMRIRDVPALKVRFRATALNNRKKAYVDAVRIQAAYH